MMPKTDLVGILTAGFSNYYLKEAKSAASYKGIMDGYEYEMGILYDEWSNSIPSDASFIDQLNSLVAFLKKKRN